MAIRKSALSLAAVLALFPLMAHAERVGNVGAVNVAAHGTPPGGSKRALSVGLGIEKRERIETSTDGSAQIVFNDTSTMTVGRNSSVVIDDFVFHGNGGAQGVSVAKGVLRFVGGGVSHNSGAQLKTPTASIGVRGGSVLVQIGGFCGTLIVHEIGSVDVVGASGNSETLNRAGFGVCINNGVVSEPFRVPPDVIAQILAQLASQGGQNGGAKKKPTNEEANLLLGDTRPPSVDPPPGLEALATFWVGNSLVQSQANTQNQPLPPPPPPPQEVDSSYYYSSPGGNWQ